MKVTITKSNKSATQHGRCGTQNNSRFTGSTVVYVVQVDGGVRGHAWQCSTKWLAQDFAKFVGSLTEEKLNSSEFYFRKDLTASSRFHSASSAALESCFPVDVETGEYKFVA